MSYSFEEYQYESGATRNRELGIEMEQHSYAYGLAGEVGEIMEQLKKEHFHAYTTNPQKLQDEIGDLLWYIAQLCTVYDLDMATCAAQNVCKLRNRYPDGFEPGGGKR